MCLFMYLNLQKLSVVPEDLSLCHNEDNSLDIKYFAARHKRALALGDGCKRILHEPMSSVTTCHNIVLPLTMGK